MYSWAGWMGRFEMCGSMSSWRQHGSAEAGQETFSCLPMTTCEVEVRANFADLRTVQS